MENHIEELLSIPLFQRIQPSELKSMLGCLQGYVKHCKKGEYIIYEQDIVKNVGIVITGSIDMIKEDMWGNKNTIVRIEAKELFGETFACAQNPLSAVSFCAASDSKVMLVPFARVMHTCSNSCRFHHQLIENMVSIIAAKNRQLMNKMEIISQKTIREKIFVYLSFQAQEQGKNYFEIPFGRLELADYLCTDRSALTRELSNMKKDKIIDFDKNTFFLHKEN